jgi:hypothetical protein
MMQQNKTATIYLTVQATIALFLKQPIVEEQELANLFLSELTAAES